MCVQYCAKEMQAKCANFVLCSCELWESLRDNLRPFERNFPGTNNAFSLTFRYKTKFHDQKCCFTNLVHEISCYTDATTLHTISSIYQSYNVHEIYKRFSTHSFAGVWSRTQRMRISIGNLSVRETIRD